jgi:hypothetical protein
MSILWNGKFAGILELPCYKIARFISIENFFIRLVHLCLFPVDGEYQALALQVTSVTIINQ